MTLTSTADRLIPELKPLQQKLLMAGGIGAVLSAVGALLNPAMFFRAYLTTYLLMLGITLGCLAIGMIHQVSGGAWGVIIRRILGAATRTLPMMTVLFLPIVVGMKYLYPWTDAAAVAGDAALQWKRPYLNVPFFLIRAVFYFAVWNGIVFLLNRWALEQDETGDPLIAKRMQKLAAGGLLAYGLTISFASYDWAMSLDPRWASTMFGVLIMGGQGLSAMAFSIVALAWLSRREPLRSIVTPDLFHDLGNLLLAFTMLWAYFGFSQYLIIWSGNLPEEAEWYVRRSEHGWGLVALLLVAFHFVVPFLLLLLRVTKRRGDTLARLAAGILVMRYVDLFWLTQPSLRPSLSVSWIDVVLPLAFAAVWLGMFVGYLRDRALLPLHDPEFDEAVGAHVRTA